MTTTKTIKITGQEILEHYVSVSEECTIAEARDILKNANIFLDILQTGDFDAGTYKRSLKEILVTYEK